MRFSIARSTIVVAIVLGLLVGHAHAAKPGERFAGPWDMTQLKKTPHATWGAKSGLLQEVYYQGEPLNGKPTRVFAYCGRPANGDGPFPAMVLVHGGGGTAFAEWAKLWAGRGYVALAMDLGGCGPGRKRLSDGGPGQGHEDKFREFTDDEVNQMWTYHAVAAVVRGHSLLASLDEVDADRIGVTGISWGGYLTCILAGVDDRLKVAVPVYGCGFLHHNSVWLPTFNKMGEDRTKHWVSYFDPSRYLPGVQCPMLFINGTNDFAYPLDSHQKCRQLVSGQMYTKIQVRMPHGHTAGWAPKEIAIFINSVLTDGVLLPKLGPMDTVGGSATAVFSSQRPVANGQIHYTTDSGVWEKRVWHSVDAQLSGSTVSAKLPTGRQLTYYLSVTDDRNATVSTGHDTLP